MSAGLGVFTPWLRGLTGCNIATILPPPPKSPSASWQSNGRLELSGEWARGSAPVAIDGAAPGGAPSSFLTTELGTFDSTLPAFVFARLRGAGGSKEPLPPLDGLPDNLRGLLELALAVPEETPYKDDSSASSFLGRVGLLTNHVCASAIELLEFIGLTTLSLIRFVTSRAHFRSIDFWIILQECGYKALPIVTLISFLIGLILAFVGNVQLTNFGANLYVADLVGIAMVREMGVVMTAIIMSGRTGAAFAAHIGSMKANEEIDALRTFGFDPFDFLVLPRLIALVLMMPLLTIYSNVVGILGGMLVGAFVDIPPILYWNETLSAVDITNASLGVFKSVFFGAAIAISGCMQGMKAGKSSAAVGEATTKAVVTAITSIVVLDSAFAAIFTLLEI